MFREAAQDVALRFDALSEMHVNLYDNVLFEKYLDWDDPTIVRTFEEVIGKYAVTIAAATIGDNSKEPIVGRDGYETLREKVLTHAISIPMTDEDYRNILLVLDSKRITDRAKKQKLVNTMFKDAKQAVGGVLSKLDLIFLTALSNCGRFEFDAENNPEGGVRGVIDYKQPQSNIASSSVEWTEANLATVDPFEDLMQMLEAAKDKVTPTKILCHQSKIFYLLRSKKMRQVIFGTDKSNSPLTQSMLNNFLAENEMPTLEAVKREIRIQNNGKQVKSVFPWNPKNLVFIPEGKLGIVKNAYCNNELRPEKNIDYSNYNRVRVSQWGVGEAQNSNYVQMTKAQVVALPVITEMEGIYTLKTEA